MIFVGVCMCVCVRVQGGRRGLHNELVKFTDRASEKRVKHKREWETAGDENLGFWFVSKCLTQMDMAFKPGGQAQLLINTNTKQCKEGR